MTDIERAIEQAWDHIEPKLSPNPAELRRRLERGKKLAARPPRSWCLVVRANDTRINPDTAYITPQSAYPRSGDPPGQRAIEARHEVTLTGDLLRDLSAPVYIDPPGQTTHEVAMKLGVTPNGLLWSRLRGVFQTHHVRGLDGTGDTPIPLLYSKTPLLPNAPLFAPADGEWGETAQLLCERVPTDFDQTIVRVPALWPRGTFVDEQERGWERESAREPRQPAPRKLPPPEPDPVPYKWKDGKYLGYDWRMPGAKERYDKRMRAKEAQHERDRRRVREPKSLGSHEFRGWLWLCPVCDKPVKMLYLPLSPMELMPQSLEAWMSEREAIRRFACRDCQHVTAFRRAHRNYWNEVVSYLSWGLLYGSEVQRPPSWTQSPKRSRPKLGLQPATRKRHEALAQRLMEGWTYGQIAAELGISYCTVVGRIARVYAERRVRGGRKGLAAAMGVAAPARRPKRGSVANGI